MENHGVVKSAQLPFPTLWHVARCAAGSPQYVFKPPSSIGGKDGSITRTVNMLQYLFLILDRLRSYVFLMVLQY